MYGAVVRGCTVEDGQICGRYQSRFDKQRIAEEFHVRNLDDITLHPSYNIAPTSMQPVIVKDRDTGERVIHIMRWGLIPPWSTDAKSLGVSTINAKAESLMVKPIWRIPFKKRRCIIPADGFYEWRRLGAKTKQPYLFSLRTGMMGFAAVWESWTDPAIGQALETYSIITTESNELTAMVHNRMPVILKAQDYERWLTRADQDQLPVDLLRPHDADKMRAWTVDPRVGNVKNDEPGLCDKWTCPPNSA